MPKVRVQIEIPDHRGQIECSVHVQRMTYDDLVEAIMLWCAEHGYHYDDISWDWEPGEE